MSTPVTPGPFNLLYRPTNHCLDPGLSPEGQKTEKRGGDRLKYLLNTMEEP